MPDGHVRMGMRDGRDADMVGGGSGGLVRCGGVVVVGGVDNKVGRSALAPVRLALHAQTCTCTCTH